MNLTNSLVQVVCNATLQVYGGDLYVGVMTIINSLREVFMMPIHGLSNGAQPVTGYNYGGGLYSRVRQSIRFSVAGTVGCAALFWAAAMVFPGALIRIFNGDAEMLAAGVPAMRIYFCLFIPMSLQMAGQGVFVSLGRSRQAIFFSLLRKAVINAPDSSASGLDGDGRGVRGGGGVPAGGGLACIITMYLTVYRPFGRLPDRAGGCKEGIERTAEKLSLFVKTAGSGAAGRTGCFCGVGAYAPVTYFVWVLVSRPALFSREDRYDDLVPLLSELQLLGNDITVGHCITGDHSRIIFGKAVI